MCTVSFVKTNDKVIITSNRDESVIRLNAIHPMEYIVNNKKVIYPKDPKAGGTWYAIDENGTVLVLLNGAEEKHEYKPPYRKSRGLIVLDVIGNLSPKQYWDTIELDNIEPFTIVLYQEGQLYQLRWDGTFKYTNLLDVNKKHIWASSTLYPKEIRDKRAKLFHAFLDNKEDVSEIEMYHFHRYTEADNPENGLVINRNDFLKTLSITQSVLQQNEVKVKHYDLINETEFKMSFQIN
ncbi:NRDE family protein [Flavobacterium sp. NG2]|uniref:NRDE family protein n=1 Tax=Flavobacterium sp. NG2 TaxID=3097547 RepID=UPI002A8408A2|nr:NRDE family protein [Flavobacterium sp. NG2]WPR72663.1 NRDE family protein [Flavobacterium sp. NG2]